MNEAVLGDVGRKIRELRFAHHREQRRGRMNLIGCLLRWAHALLFNCASSNLVGSSPHVSQPERDSRANNSQRGASGNMRSSLSCSSVGLRQCCCRAATIRLRSLRETRFGSPTVP
jgi:hypothetical protein